MKYFKILAALCFPLCLVACEEDENYNSGSATVEFDKTEISISEITKSTVIPITVKGEHNGLVKVKVALKENQLFEEDKDILITSKELYLPANTESVNLEVFLSIANDMIEQGRSFAFEITEANGATVGTNKTCKVDVIESNPLEGDYKLVGESLLSTGGMASVSCELVQVEGSDDEMYLNFGYGGAAIVKFKEEVPGSKYKITIDCPQVIGQYGSYGDLYLNLYTVQNGSWKPSESVLEGTFENRVIDFGVTGLALEIPGAGYLALPAAYKDESGNTVPLKLIKQ